MKAVIWGMIAITLTLGNLLFGLGTTNKTGTYGEASAIVVGALGFCMFPYVLASICLFSKKYRNAACFFKAVAWMSGFIFLGILVHIPTPSVH